MSTPLRSVRVRTDVTRVLVVTAHPDDVDFGAAGTVATWTAAGIEVAYCICTSGDAGGFDDDPARRDGAPARGRAAGRREGGRRLRRPVPRLPRRPPHPEPRAAPRHQPGDPPLPAAAGADPVAGDLVAPPPRLAPGPPRRPARPPSPPSTPTRATPSPIRSCSPTRASNRGPCGELWLMAAPDERIDHVVDITDTVGRKVAALRAHASQTAHMTGPRPTNPQPGRYVGPPLRTDRRAHRRGVPDRVDRLTVGDRR